MVVGFGVRRQRMPAVLDPTSTRLELLGGGGDYPAPQSIEWGCRNCPKFVQGNRELVNDSGERKVMRGNKKKVRGGGCKNREEGEN